MTEKIMPKLTLIAIEETQYWVKEITEKTGRIFSYFLVDESVYTFLCSLTPSLYLHYISFETEKELNDEAYEDLQNEVCLYQESGDYCSLSIVNTPYKKDVTEYHVNKFPGYDDQEDYNEWINDILEHYQGNSPCISGLFNDDL